MVHQEGYAGGRDEHGASGRVELAYWDTQISARAMASIADRVGITICVIILIGSVARRHLYMHGEISVRVESPTYSMEVQWLMQSQQCTSG